MIKKGFWFVGIGLEGGFLVWMAVYFGQKGDNYFNTKGWITAGGIVLALVVWFWSLIKLLTYKKTEENSSK